MRAFLIVTLLISGAAAHADETPPSVSTSPGASGPARYDEPQEFLSIQAGPYHPEAATVSNGTYSFSYGDDSLNTALLEAVFGHRLARWSPGSLFLEAGVAYAGFSAAVSNLHLNTVGVDGRLGFYFDRLPMAWLIPFVDAGGQYTLYFQSGDTDFDSAQGTTWNFVAGAGLRFWLNPSSLDRDYFARSPGFPIYLSLKVNQLFPSAGGLNLAATDWLAGLSVGL
jgi:hypothetical protein